MNEGGKRKGREEKERERRKRSADGREVQWTKRSNENEPMTTWYRHGAFYKASSKGEGWRDEKSESLRQHHGIADTLCTLRSSSPRFSPSRIFFSSLSLSRARLSLLVHTHARISSNPSESTRFKSPILQLSRLLPPSHSAFHPSRSTIYRCSVRLSINKPYRSYRIETIEPKESRKNFPPSFSLSLSLFFVRPISTNIPSLSKVTLVAGMVGWT